MKRIFALTLSLSCFLLQNPLLASNKQEYKCCRVMCLATIAACIGCAEYLTLVQQHNHAQLLHNDFKALTNAINSHHSLPRVGPTPISMDDVPNPVRPLSKLQQEIKKKN